MLCQKTAKHAESTGFHDIIGGNQVDKVTLNHTEKPVQCDAGAGVSLCLKNSSDETLLALLLQRIKMFHVASFEPSSMAISSSGE